MTITLPEIDTELDEAIEQLIADLEFARDYIVKHGLAKRVFFSVWNNSTCSEGAIMRAIGPGAGASPRRYRAMYALGSILGAESQSDAQKAVYDFNDSPLTEREDVVALFNVAIDRLRG